MHHAVGMLHHDVGHAISSQASNFMLLGYGADVAAHAVSHAASDVATFFSHGASSFVHGVSDF